ncbi:MAG TPA: hypothetical protein VD905_17825 [Flavobacteriales bacterium]|nr:hypothetical protein [Flavobacteriales bacterium]
MKTHFKNVIDLPQILIRERHDGIIQVTFKEGCTLDLELQVRAFEKYTEICSGKRRPFMFEAMDHVTITKEAKEYAVKIEDIAPIKASAILVNNLGYKLIAEFYYRINKPRKPFKIFNKEEKAIEWLKQFLTDSPFENSKSHTSK